MPQVAPLNSTQYYHGGQTFHHITSILGMLAQIAPLYSVYKAPSYQPDFILLALVSIKLAYQSMLFILELAYNAGSADQLKNKHVQLSRVWKKKNDTIRVESDSYDGAWYAENISTAFVTKTQVSDE